MSEARRPANGTELFAPRCVSAVRRGCFRHRPGRSPWDALETILARATVPILRQAEQRPPELVVALLPRLIRTMLTAFCGSDGEATGGEGVKHDAPPDIAATAQSEAPGDVSGRWADQVVDLR
jgi:hypothetical protein